MKNGSIIYLEISCLLHYLGVSGPPLAFFKAISYELRVAVVPMDNR